MKSKIYKRIRVEFPPMDVYENNNNNKKKYVFYKGELFEYVDTRIEVNTER